MKRKQKKMKKKEIKKNKKKPPFVQFYVSKYKFISPRLQITLIIEGLCYCCRV